MGINISTACGLILKYTMKYLKTYVKKVQSNKIFTN